MKQLTVTVYADLFFIINMLFDTLILYITARITSSPFKVLRIIFGGVFGALYALFCLVAVNSFLLHPIAAFLMCIISFGKNRTFYNTAVFILSCALAGGAVYGFFYALGKDEAYIYSMGGKTVIVCTVVALVLTGGYFFVCKKSSGTGTVHAYITVGNKEYSAFLLKDNGNLLTDPISLDPVMVVSEGLFEKELRTPETSPVPMRVIPIKTAAGSDVLFGFRPKKCIIREFGKTKTREIRVIVALTKENRFGGVYDGLMPNV